MAKTYISKNLTKIRTRIDRAGNVIEETINGKTVDEQNISRQNTELQRMIEIQKEHIKKLEEQLKKDESTNA